MALIGKIPAGVRLDEWPTKCVEQDEYAPEILALRQQLIESVPALAPQLEALEGMREIRQLIGTVAGPRTATLVLERT